MSKRKHFHSIGSGKKMFQYAALYGVGLPRRFLPKGKTPTSKKTAPAAKPRGLAWALSVEKPGKNRKGGR